MIPALPRAADITTCTTDAALLRMIGQAALPLLIVYHQSRLPLRLPRRVGLSVALRPFVCRVMFDGPRKEVPVAGGSVTRVIQTGPPEAALEYWPGQRRAI